LIPGIKKRSEQTGRMIKSRMSEVRIEKIKSKKEINRKGIENMKTLNFIFFAL
jgi:hypothetical protein